ncbi:PTS sugar transporter subunit IIA [Roseicitreum antarcticum]|uniref:PTS IIA-like nitrogen-regulatory protein PtsN n=1 Tax=Roseicitreum antarcticum TaxID=564137 RepID=A0A1H2X6N4_9RHOB|nr:PTS sugar transporter subunit IIA [Roseicitreum antarcticum]SDW88428.1 PTS IIA-like nitrogen-regulatory protein PtsN [Roseicitreum antarcticum]
MELSLILKPDAVRAVHGVSSKKRLFQDLADLAKVVYGLDSMVALNSLQERESLGPTGVGHGVALPHARLDGLERVSGVFFRLDKAFDYGSVDKAPVDLVFALFAPRDAGVDHLKALALVSRTLRDPAVCRQLRANTDAATLHAVLTAARDIKAA